MLLADPPNANKSQGKPFKLNLGREGFQKNLNSKSQLFQNWCGPPPPPQNQTWKITIFLTLKFLVSDLAEKKHVNYEKLEIATKQCKSNIKPKFILFPLFAVAN